MKELEIIKVLAPYLVVFPECKLDKTGLRIYAVALSEYEPQIVNVAMQKLVKTVKFFPRVADIITAIRELEDYTARQQGKGELTAGEAWEDVQRELRSRSYYSSAPWQFATKEVEKAARQFGLEELATLEMSNVNTARAQFMRIYEAIIHKTKQDKENAKALNALGDSAKELFSEVSRLKQLGGVKNAD